MRNYKHEILRDGTLLNVTLNKVLHGCKTGEYTTFCINGKTFMAHRMVAEKYIKKINENTEVNHINGNKHDNRVENLEWVTASENVKHAYATGLLDKVKNKDLVGMNMNKFISLMAEYIYNKK